METKYFKSKKLFILFVFLLISLVAFEQRVSSRADTTRPTTQRSSMMYNPPADTTSRPNNNNNEKSNSKGSRVTYTPVIDSTPKPKQQYVLGVLKSLDIYPNADAYRLIELLNPQLSSLDMVKANYPIVLPRFPEPSKQARRALKDAYKDALKTDVNVNSAYLMSVRRFDTLANIFHTLDFNNTSSNTVLQNYIKDILPSLAEISNNATAKTEHTSKSTVGLLNKETQAMNIKLKAAVDTRSLSAADTRVIYLLIRGINSLVYTITNQQLRIQNFKAFNSHAMAFYNASYEQADKILQSQNESLTDNSDPQQFNIYVFKEGLVVNTQKKEPEMQEYTIRYALPALASDSAEWSELPEPASTASCYLPPADFKFSVYDNFTQDVFYEDVDVSTASRDDLRSWTLADLFRKTYKLIFIAR